MAQAESTGLTPETAATGGHVFERELVDGNPVIACIVCDLIWWPDQRFPKQTCRQRQAANARRR